MPNFPFFKTVFLLIMNINCAYYKQKKSMNKKLKLRPCVAQWLHQSFVRFPYFFIIHVKNWGERKKKTFLILIIFVPKQVRK